MNVKEFKAMAVKYADRFTIDFCTKKEMIDWCIDCGQIVSERDNDIHVYVFVGNEFYSDEQVTSAILRKADYIELSDADGWMWYISSKCPGAVLDEAYDVTIGFYTEEEEIA